MLKKRFNLPTPRRSICIVVVGLLLFCSFANRNADSSDKDYLLKAPIKHLSETGSSFENIASLVKWPYEESDLSPDPALVFGNLPNGFRYVLMENQVPKNRVSMHLVVHAGSINETDGQQGLAHFLEHMLFNGSTHFKPGELVKYFQSIGMEFGPDANAHTGFKKTVYDLLLPDGNRKSLEDGLLVIQDYAEGALLLQSEIDRERRIVLAEKRTRDSTQYRTFIAGMKFKFPEARLSKRFPIGIDSVLKRVNHKQFKDFYDTWYRPEKMTLVLIGDFDAQIAASIIEEKFSSLSVRGPPNNDLGIGKIRHEGIKPFYHFEKEMGNTSVGIEIIQKILKNPDSFSFRHNLLKEHIANRIVQNRLNALIRKADSPITSASVNSGIYLQEIKYAEITTDTSPENWEKSLFLMEQTLRKALKYGFTNQELERVKKDYLSDLDDAVEKAPTRNSGDLVRELIWSLNAGRVFMSPEQEKNLYAPLVKSSTVKSIHDAFKAIWAPSHRLVLVTGNAKLEGMNIDPENIILAAYNKSEVMEVSKPIKTKPVVFPYLPEPEKEGKVVQKKTILDVGVVQVDFENGVRLNLKKTDFKANEVLVNLTFGSGRSVEPSDKPGLAALSTKVINESGLEKLSKEEIERAMAGTNTTVTFQIGEDSFSFRGNTVPKEVTLLFQLLYAHLVDPGFRSDAYTLTMERFRQQYRSLSSSINGAMVLHGRRFLAGGDSRFGLPSHDEFKQLTLDDVRSLINRSLKADNIEVSVVGDFDIDSIVKLASKYLGSLSLGSRVHAQQGSKLPHFPTNRSLELSVPTEIPKGLVVVAFPTEDLWNIKKTRRFSILSHIVSDRLREKIREKLGSAYSTYAFNRPSRAYPGYGIFQAVVHVDPEEDDQVVIEVMNIISDLAEHGVTQDELNRAVAPTLTSIKDMLRKNNYWLNTVLSGSKNHPQQLDWSRTILEDYASITKEEVSILSKQYFDMNKVATVIIKPAKK